MTQIYDSWKLKFTNDICTIRYEKYISTINELLEIIEKKHILTASLITFLERFYVINNTKIVYAEKSIEYTSKKHIIDDTEIFLSLATHIYGYNLLTNTYKIYVYCDNKIYIKNLLIEYLTPDIINSLECCLDISNAYIYSNNTYTSIYFTNTTNTKIYTQINNLARLLDMFLNNKEISNILDTYKEFIISHIGYTLYKASKNKYELKISILQFN